MSAYAEIPECKAFIDTVRGDDETAVAGREVSYSRGNTAVKATITFYRDQASAIEHGPALLLDERYQRCLQTIMVSSIEETNDTAEQPRIVSEPFVVPGFGDETVAVQYVAAFTIPLLGPKILYTDELSVRIGRAVLLMQWSSDIDFDPVEIELFQLLGERFTQELAD